MLVHDAARIDSLFGWCSFFSFFGGAIFWILDIGSDRMLFQEGYFFIGWSFDSSFLCIDNRRMTEILPGIAQK